jgi:membrane associated rhomboid family serine protease
VVLIVLNVAFFAYEQFLARKNPLARFLFEQRHALSLTGVQHGAWWQVFTFQFLHGGLFHLVMNLLLLHSLGPVMETTLGRWRYLTLYLVSGSIGGLLQLLGAWVAPTQFGSMVVGASAGLCGLLAALAAVYAEEKLQLLLLFVIPVQVRAKYVLLIAAAVSALGVIYARGKVAHLSHLGGLIGGLWCINWWRVKPVLTTIDSSDETSRR